MHYVLGIWIYAQHMIYYQYYDSDNYYHYDDYHCYYDHHYQYIIANHFVLNMIMLYSLYLI